MTQGEGLVADRFNNQRSRQDHQHQLRDKSLKGDNNWFNQHRHAQQRLPLQNVHYQRFLGNALTAGHEIQSTMQCSAPHHVAQT